MTAYDAFHNVAKEKNMSFEVKMIGETPFNRNGKERKIFIEENLEHLK